MKIEQIRYRLPFFPHRLVTPYVVYTGGHWHRVYRTGPPSPGRLYIMMGAKQVFDGIGEVVENCKFKGGSK